MYKDQITLKLPTKKEYVKIARLTAASIAANMNFDIEMLEDIKVAVGEAMNIAFKFENEKFKEIELFFQVNENVFEVKVNYPGCLESEIKKNESDDLSFLILKSLMDDVKTSCDSHSASLVMQKRLDV